MKPRVFDEIGGADDVGMLEVRLAPPLTQKAGLDLRIGGELGAEKLDGHQVIEMDVPGLPYFGHSALAQFLEKLVLTDLPPRLHAAATSLTTQRSCGPRELRPGQLRRDLPATDSGRIRTGNFRCARK